MSQPILDRLAELLSQPASETTRQAAARLVVELTLQAPAGSSAYEESPEPVFVLDSRGRLRDVNGLACSLVGRTRDALIGTDPQELAPSEDRAHSLFDVDLTTPAVPCRRERRLRRKDGAVLWCEVSTLRLHDGSRLAFVRDITAQKRLAENLRSNELRLQALVSAVDEIVYEIDGGGAIINVWAKDTTLLMRPRAELIGRALSDLFTEPQTQQFLSAIRRVLNTGQPENLEYPLTLGGSEHWFQARVAPVSSANSLVKTVCLVARDVTERYQAEQALSATAAEVSALYRATAGLLSVSGDSAQLVRAIAQALAAELAPVCCALYLPEPDEVSLVCKALAGDFDAAYGPVSAGGPGLIALAFGTGESLYAPDAVNDPRYLQGDARTRSEVATPLTGTSADGSTRVIGVLDLQSPRVDAFSPRALRMISLFAEQAGLALASAQLMTHLVQARADAEEASRLKSEFLANTSHELRTPLSTIMGALEIVIDGLASDPAEERRLLNTAHLSAERLLYLISDLLDFAKVEAGRMEVDLQIVNIGPILADVYLMARNDAERKGLEIEMDLPATVPTVRADAYKLRQVLLGVVSNAVKFTEQGAVTVTVADRFNAVVITVADTGIGIEESKAAEIFEPFVQGDGSSTRRYGGTGLGLAISRRLMLLMGGELRLTRTAPGGGSVFEVVVPLAR
ncbi:MAG: PAS domain S-box protein [Anaerolineales bacterium]|nr:PAS domain S-box protein [Anaerolineales bacterium]